MKKILALVLALSFVSFAGEKKANLKDVMLKMEESTIKILKGFLRNQPNLILEGAEYIKNHPDITQQVLEYAKPERRTEGFKKYTAEFDKFVREEASKIEKYIKNGNKAKASEYFAQMLDRCNGCHAVFRGW
ncbi:cytochrome c [Hydrogenothermus marinus]|uniref:Cytochrome c n=1 Tax=Hydrogenothermus marinus TaxID=133270 RepID=A0A3M0BAQ0_9AQUI|nr:cytochrome c [Hydrogenothermus marinus]RMA93249.1 cytochrome c' [Hydrogenothermus marinus]